VNQENSEQSVEQAYQHLSEWARSVGLSLPNLSGAASRVEAVAQLLAQLRLKSDFPPIEPNRDDFRILMRAYLDSDQNKEVMKDNLTGDKIDLFIEKMIIESAQKIVSDSENQPWNKKGCQP